MGAKTYKFIDFAQKMEIIYAKYGIDEKTCQVLRAVVRAQLRHKPMQVRQLLGLSQIGAPATIHKMMKNLVARKFLLLGDNPSDKRIKYLYPAPPTLNFFKELSSKMSSC